MTCEKYRELIIDYTHGELDAATDATVFEHIQSCGSCKAEWQIETSLTETLRAACATELDLPMSVVAKVRQTVRGQSSPGILTSLRTWLRPAVLAPTAAMLLLIAVVARYGQVHTPPNVPQVSADYLVRQHLVQTMGSQSNDRAYTEYLLTSANDQSQNAVTP